MYKYKAGFIGAGHMGGILAGVVCQTAGGDNVAVTCTSPGRSAAVAEKLGCRYDTAANIISESEYIFIGLRPAQLDDFIKQYKSVIEGAQGTLVSMLSGVSIEKLEQKTGAGKKIIRIMPNTPCEIGKGLIGYAYNHNADKLCDLEKLLAPAGLVEEIPESEMDIFSVIAACAPAYTYYFADALAEAAAGCGMDKAKAVKYAAQMLEGSAGMIMKGGKTPQKLMNEVCTPGGTTIEGVSRMKAGGFEELIAESVGASYNKTVGR